MDDPSVNDPNPSADPSAANRPVSYQAPSLKEQKEQLGVVISKEPGLDKVQYQEYQETELGPEVKDWMEKVENGQSVNLNQPVVDDYGQILLDNSTSQQPQLILPLDEEEVRKGLHTRIADSIRWLAEWCWRLLKMGGKRIEYK
jgi:hypothetical protein